MLAVTAWSTIMRLSLIHWRKTANKADRDVTAVAGVAVVAQELNQVCPGCLKRLSRG